MLEELDELDRLSLVAKICTELENHIGISDKTLSEFILSLYDSKLSTFTSRLTENGADFPGNFVTNLHRLISQMLPGLLGIEETVEENGGDYEHSRQSTTSGKFPGLSLPNDIKPFVDDYHLTAKDAPRRPSPDRRGRSRSPPPSYDSSKNSRDRTDQRRRDDYNHSRNGGGREDDEPILFKIYDGRVTNTKEFGAFVALEGVRGRREGLVHVSAITNTGRITHPNDVLKRGQRVKVKVASIAGSRIGLNMRDVDQNSGRDLAPELNVNQQQQQQQRTASSSADQSSANVPGTNRRGVQRLTSPELWEIKQLIASGVLNPADYPTVNMMDDAEEAAVGFGAEEDLDIEIKDEEPLFLKGQTNRTLDLSPVQIVKVPDGSLNRAAMAGAAFAKERKEMKRQKESEEAAEAAPKDLGQSWMDPMSTQTDRQLAQDAKSAAVLRKGPAEMPEWKRETLGKSATFGKRTNLSIQEQRESLPVFKLRSDLVRAILENQILVVIGDTG